MQVIRFHVYLKADLQKTNKQTNKNRDKAPQNNKKKPHSKPQELGIRKRMGI